MSLKYSNLVQPTSDADLHLIWKPGERKKEGGELERGRGLTEKGGGLPFWELGRMVFSKYEGNFLSIWKTWLTNVFYYQVPHCSDASDSLLK